jgi:hypothetical protein
VPASLEVGAGAIEAEVAGAGVTGAGVSGAVVTSWEPVLPELESLELKFLVPVLLKQESLALASADVTS